MADPIRGRRIDSDVELVQDRHLVVGIDDLVLGIKPREVPINSIARTPDRTVCAQDAGVPVCSGNANGIVGERRVQHRR